MPSTSGAASDRSLGELSQVVARAQHDRLDAALPTQVDQPEALGLSPTGPSEVHQ
jgi:hypothetical protein